MKISNTGLYLIKKYEGFESRPYICAGGRLTIGYGFTFYPDGKKVSEFDYIKQSQAEEFLELIVNKDFGGEILKLVKVPLSQEQFDAICSFCYNLGMGNFRSSTLLKKLNSGDYEGAGEEFGRWIFANGVKLEGLVKRRAQEMELFLS